MGASSLHRANREPAPERVSSARAEAETERGTDLTCCVAENRDGGKVFVRGGVAEFDEPER